MPGARFLCENNDSSKCVKERDVRFGLANSVVSCNNFIQLPLLGRSFVKSARDCTYIYTRMYASLQNRSSLLFSQRSLHLSIYYTHEHCTSSEMYSKAIISLTFTCCKFFPVLRPDRQRYSLLYVCSVPFDNGSTCAARRRDARARPCSGDRRAYLYAYVPLDGEFSFFTQSYNVLIMLSL